MRSIKIDARNKTVEEIELDDKDTLGGMQKVVGGYIEVAHNDGKNTLYVDEEGLYKGGQDFFTYDGAHQPFVGNGLWCGVNHKNGKTVKCTLTVEEVRSKVRFMDLQTVRTMV